MAIAAIPFALFALLPLSNAQEAERPILGHGDLKYEVHLDWAKADPAVAPVINSHDIDEDKAGNIYVVTDHPTNAFVVFSKDGEYLRSFGKGLFGGHGLEIFEHDGTEYLVHVDCGWHFEAEGWKARPGNGSVTLLKTDGTIVRTLPTPMELGLIEDKDRAFMPCDVAATPQGTLLIADGYASDRIYELTLDGKHVQTWGGHKAGDDAHLSNAHGISVDTADPERPLIWVSSRNQNQVKAFTMKGEHVETIELPGAYAGGFTIANGKMYTAVCWSKENGTGKRLGQSGFLVVLDHKTRKVISAPGGSEPVYKDGKLQPLMQTSKTWLHGHDVHVDAEGAVYFGEWNANRRYPSKLVPVKAEGKVKGKGNTKVAPAAPRSTVWNLNDLRNARAAFESGKGTVAFMGGSITEMDGYRPMVMGDLQKRFPTTEFTWIDAGISSTCSTTGAMRLPEHVLAKGTPDLFFVEFAVNDDQDAGHAEREALRGMEGIIRQCRREHPKMDIVMTYFTNTGMIEKLQAGDDPVSVAAHSKVARHYDVPVIHLAEEVAIALKAGDYTWKDFGGVHPKPFGNRIAADMIAELCASSWDAPGASAKKPMEHAMPKPLDPLNYEHGRFLPAEAVKGWEYGVPAWDTLKGGKRKRYSLFRCWVSEGAAKAEDAKVATVTFEGTGVGAFVLAGPDAGVVHHRVDGGTWQETNLKHHYSKGLHYPRTVMFATDLAAGKHTLDVRVKEAGTFARVIHFVAK